MLFHEADVLCNTTKDVLGITRSSWTDSMVLQLLSDSVTKETVSTILNKEEYGTTAYALNKHINKLKDIYKDVYYVERYGAKVVWKPTDDDLNSDDWEVVNK